MFNIAFNTSILIKPNEAIKHKINRCKDLLDHQWSNGLCRLLLSGVIKKKLFCGSSTPNVGETVRIRENK